MKNWLYLAFLFLAPLHLQAQQGSAGLISAERDFARAAVQTSTKQAFLANMADSAIMFANGRPELAKPSWQKRAEQPNAPKLIWGPAFASLSGSADLGYTTGPWLIEQPDGKRVAYGQFFTLWGRQTDGSWKFLLDVGVSHPQPAAPEPPANVVARPIAQTRLTKTSRIQLPGLDQELNAAIAARGPGSGYAAWLSPQARLLRKNTPPLTSPAAVAAQVAAELPRRFTPQGSHLARAHDLGYTYGTYLGVQNSTDQGGYLHVWQQEAGRWRLVAEVLTPTAPPKP
ncbi:DUF4440 domain-containing protein [Hymenobacter cellulosivorans]|uniref:DUF4440 domain-containing protein n=1 Tax=Hymenobacter cellulosivorans TaxID=2932249 RepID=A0ABY4F2L1_9BACT|nr:DUF4440 domain-containing protein [Hymenobacter cellulosivorans]UOQ50905.1 DUF4440 domain-containing protein [Hymenobacter cellulosivorans]